ncbi:unnamed protein product [Plutella xylostella]|uniref:(diamondback moth) hypothetical protein n=1 Tax=Plutella xylostella TaxID=51655 RepID=A0A8S4GAT0_PLUXY|nr:unnamed protein product [Plutella xylostella]
MLGSRKGVNLPGLPVICRPFPRKTSLICCSELSRGVDMIFASFIRNGAALTEIRGILARRQEHQDHLQDREPPGHGQLGRDYCCI